MHPELEVEDGERKSLSRASASIVESKVTKRRIVTRKRAEKW
jgi:hypothetical protein